jgi:flagellar hook assembly protein FlgD
MAKAIVVDVISLIGELVEVRKAKSVLSARESNIRKSVLDATGNIAITIVDNSGVVVAEVVESVRRSVNDWDEFEATYPEAYEALAKFTDVLTLNTL